MNGQAKQAINEAEKYAYDTAYMFYGLLYKLELIKPELPNWILPKDHNDRLNKLNAYAHSKCNEAGKAMRKYSKAAKHIRQWGFVTNKVGIVAYNRIDLIIR